MNRPTLLPGLPRAWRGPTELQLGSGPRRAVLLHLPDRRAAQVLDLLDGRRSEQSVLLEAAELGVPPDQTRAMIESLRAAGLAVAGPSLLPAGHEELLGEAAALALHGVPTPATFLRRRKAARVVITGRGRLGAPIAVALAESGVAHVHPDLTGAVTAGELPAGPLSETDVGRPRHEAIAAAILRAVPETTTTPVRRGTASLVIQLDHDEPVGLLAASFARRRQPHLMVSVREGIGMVGPLVPATGGPCLTCLDLHRLDRDAGRPGMSRSDELEPCTATTALAAAAYAADQALAFIDGRTQETLGASVEIATAGRSRRRTWPPHPRCGCVHLRTPRTRPPQPPPAGARRPSRPSDQVTSTTSDRPAAPQRRRPPTPRRPLGSPTSQASPDPAQHPNPTAPSETTKPPAAIQPPELTQPPAAGAHRHA